MKQDITIVKVGGKILEEPETLQALLHDFAAIKGAKILVHGGGRSATKIAASLGIETKMVDGRRITDTAMLQVVTMVYGGLVNKQVVAKLQALGVNALGVTGADLNLITSRKRPVVTVDYGWVGDVIATNAPMFTTLVNAGITPVIAPLTHDNAGNLLNTNADTMAAQTAIACAGNYNVTLIYCFEKQGVLLNENDDNSVIPLINQDRYQQLLSQKIISGGMIPKLDNAFATLNAGVNKVIITKAANLNNLEQGTHLTK